MSVVAAAALVAEEARRTAAHPAGPERTAMLRRKVAVATWRPPTEGRLMTRIVVDAEPALSYVAARRAEGARGLTLMHVVGAAAARAVLTVPQLNTRVRAGRVVGFEDVSVGFAVDIGRGADLAPVKVPGATDLTPAQIATRVWEGVDALRDGTDPGFRRSTRVAKWTPRLLMKPMLLAGSVVLGGWGLPLMGQQGNPLGSVFISNVAPLGIEEAFLAPVPFARTPVYLSLGATSERPVVRDGVVVAVRQFTMCLTADHRLVDGAQCALFLDALQRCLADPARLDRPA